MELLATTNAPHRHAAIAWLFRVGQPIYHALDSPERYAHIYGPMAFIIPSWSLGIFGACIRASKIPGAFAAVGALGLVFTLVYRIAGGRQALTLTGVLAGLCLMFQHYTFWIRPDSLLFVSQASGGLGRAVALKVGNRELTELPPESPKFRAFDKRTGEMVWEKELPFGPAAAPMTYMAGGKQYVVLAIGTGINAELVAYALP